MILHNWKREHRKCVSFIEINPILTDSIQGTFFCFSPVAEMIILKN